MCNNKSKYFIKILLFLGFSHIFIACQHSQRKSASFILIRHAEKDRTDSNNSNPHLNSLGEERSLRWKTFFKNIEFDEFYSTNYHRTIETIKPISNGREIVIYNPSTINYKDFILKNKGKTILVVGHSNTIPKFANNLINEKIYQNISDTNNSNLYVINICENSEIINRLYFIK